MRDSRFAIQPDFIWRSSQAFLTQVYLGFERYVYARKSSTSFLVASHHHESVAVSQYENLDMERHLAAILVADVVGYSRLMEVDEVGTLTALKAHRKEVVDPKIAAHRGRIVKLMGDGALMEFASVVDALACAIDIQQGIRERNQDTPAERRVSFRMGINLGDVIVEDDDIYGDGINVTARLEELAEPGAVCISEAVRTAIGNKISLDYEDLGKQNVKNISQPIHVYQVRLKPGAVLPQPATKSTQAIPKAATKRRRLVTVGALIVIVALVGVLVTMKPWEVREEPALIARMAFTLPEKPSIAVLPFNNMSGDPAQEYFGDGLTENIITSLSQTPKLFVIARNSVFTYKNRPVRVQQVAEELGIRYVLEGSFQRSGDQVRIHAQFIDALTGHHLWAERFDTVLEDIFKLQDQVTEKIVTALHVQLTKQERKRLASRYTDSYAAFDSFVRGQGLYSRFTKEDNEQARAMFQAAIDLDPLFARAYGSIALTHVEDYRAGWSDRPAWSAEQAVKFADKAIALDDTLPQTQFVRGFVYLQIEQHFEDAQIHANTAIGLDPNAADSYALLATINSYLGQLDESVRLIRKGMRLNPHAPARYFLVLGRSLYFQGEYEQAIPVLIEAVNRNPAYLLSHIYLAVAYLEIGEADEASWEATEILALAPDFSVDEWLKTQPIKDASQAERLARNLHKAGVP
jgi:TolB-like protein/class 3 adenylate cyclase/Tfp pilus assembly protein PilF